MIEPRVLKGFRDFLPTQEMDRRAAMEKLERAFQAFGFVPIDTPVLEYAEILLGKGGGETDKQLYRFEDNGGRDVAMRFDLTVPFARYMAEHLPELYLPFRRYHMAKVYRGENTQRGRYREFAQCDFDIVGADTVSCDAEILEIIAASFDALGAPEIRIHVAHRGIFNRFLDRLGVREQSEEVLRTVDKLHKVGREKTRQSLAELASADAADRILRYIEGADSWEATLDLVSEMAGGDDDDARRMAEIYEIAKSVGIAERVRFDPSITRGLDYYTGVVFETFLVQLPDIGSVCSGGRYNDLASLYTKQVIPGVGASIGLDRLMAALVDLGATVSANSATEVLVMRLDDALAPHYHAIAARLRSAGFAVEVYPQEKKLGAQFSYAEKKAIPWGVICGEDEVSEGTVQLKNLVTREASDGLTIESVVDRLRPR